MGRRLRSGFQDHDAHSRAGELVGHQSTRDSGADDDHIGLCRDAHGMSSHFGKPTFSVLGSVNSSVSHASAST